MQCSQGTGKVARHWHGGKSKIALPKLPCLMEEAMLRVKYKMACARQPILDVAL